MLVFHRPMFGGALPEAVRFYVLASDGGVGAFVRCELNEVAVIEEGGWTQPPVHMTDALAGNVVTGMDEELVTRALGRAEDVTTTNTESGTVKHLRYGNGLQVTVTDGRVSSVERR